MNFPEKLRKMRKDKGLTQEELASSIFVSRTLISKYENGSVYPTKDNVQKLALYFNVPISSLIDEEDTIQLVLKQNDLSVKINYLLCLIILIFSSLFSLMTFIPFLKVGYYDYSNGSPPTFKTDIVSPIQLTMNNSNPIVVITLVTLIVNIIISSLCLSHKKNIWLLLINYFLFIINIFLIFFTIIFTVIYISNNAYDL